MGVGSAVFTLVVDVVASGRGRHDAREHRARRDDDRRPEPRQRLGDGVDDRDDVGGSVDTR